MKHTKHHPWKRIKQPRAYRRWRERHPRLYRKLRMRFFVETGSPSQI